MPMPKQLQIPLPPKAVQKQPKNKSLFSFLKKSQKPQKAIPLPLPSPGKKQFPLPFPHIQKITPVEKSRKEAINDSTKKEIPNIPVPPQPASRKFSPEPQKNIEADMDLIKGLFKTQPQPLPQIQKIRPARKIPKIPKKKLIKTKLLTTPPHPRKLKLQQEKIRPQQEKIMQEPPQQEKSRIRELHQKLKRKLKQGYLQNKINKHIKSAKILLQQKKIERAKHQYAQALIAYYKLPEHDESLHLQLKSLLKGLEHQELQPHWHFHCKWNVQQLFQLCFAVLKVLKFAALIAHCAF